MKQPNGTDILLLLAKLLAEQEGVKIKCTVKGSKNEKSNA